MENKRIIVAGGSGFIGSHLCEFLLKQGNNVVCVDNLSSGSKKNVEHLLYNKNFELIEHDIVGQLEIKASAGQFYNLASYASPKDYYEHPLETLYAGSFGVKNTLDFARASKAKYLFASTSEVYGDPLEHPQKESYYGNVNSVGPRSCYDEAKRFGEALAVNYSKRFSVPVRIARIFNTFGPRMQADDGRVIPNFVSQALDGKPLTVYGKGQQTRSFCYVDDLVKGLVKLMESTYSMPVNLGNPTELKVIDLAKKIIAMTGSSSEIVFKTLPKDDPQRRKPDIAIAVKELGWKPTVSFDLGLKKTIDFFREAK
ncbi:MAG: SDR family oxidoreductase [Candidatus Diapherotrites archaeon]|uniref:UDP-glucuronate decarboxylase n=1 Tax=Candidatus Iainarchaeum sp. TaxID=3101447 RepID=A0A7J4IVM0_9ARCH|nr:MAG: dtdp-glucose 4-6-dehydratase [archaeon GW2011_AR10]MBS3059299.1 SDR family oxidoreductase [Candidatus Diapherotrites archaeon]HIH07767.1 SDR family oxidoreductase [Candidatus Diapherotrites archaeon]